MSAKKPHLWPITFLLGEIIKIFIKMSLSSVNSFTFYLVLISISELLCSKCCTVGWQSPAYSFFIPEVNSWSQIQRSSNKRREIKLLKQGQHENDPAEQTTEAEWRHFEQCTCTSSYLAYGAILDSIMHLILLQTCFFSVFIVKMKPLRRSNCCCLLQLNSSLHSMKEKRTLSRCHVRLKTPPYPKYWQGDCCFNIYSFQFSW